MKTVTISSVLVLFVIISVISITPAFAEVTITTGPVPLSAPGCEDTNECYTPSTATVDVGEKVIMTNTDRVGIHTYTSGTVDGFAASPDGKFDSGMLQYEDSFEWSPNTVGEYPYYCMLHVWMQGTIIVQEAGAEEMMEETMEKEVMIEKMMVGDVDVTMSPPIEGSADAPVAIIEFGDYQCPKCEQWYTNEKSTITVDYIDTGKAKLYFVDFPFLGQDSDNAANASYCADDQGKFWEYHSALYSNQGGINDGWADVNALKQFAVDLGLDTVAFNECVDSDKHKDRVDYNRMVGSSNGVEGTPVFILVGSDGKTQRINGPQSSDIFAGVIDTMLGEPVKEAMAQEETMMEKEMTESESMEKEGGGCLIATAAYGTELAPQIQFLREIRDNTVMSTASGAAFMTGFNQLYYSFSPTIADMERENPMFQEAVRAFITPMISTLSILSLAEDGNELQIFGLGASVIALNLGMYIAAPAVAGFAISKRLRN